MLILQIVFIAGIIYGIRLMASPKTAVAGNLLGALSMAGAILVTMLEAKILTVPLLWAGLLVGSALGVWLSAKVLMIQMPQMVALLNGLGGGASALVALVVSFQPSGLNTFTWFTTGLAIVVGGITLSGSLVAAGKLHGIIHQRPVHLRRHNLHLWVSIAVMLFSLGGMTFGLGSNLVHAGLLVLSSLYFGVIFTIRVGGADMPITISLLNSLSGVAGSVAGFALANGALLVVVGSIVGASGLILTEIMCRAMNRKLMQILLGKTTMAPPSGKAPSAAPKIQPKAEKEEPQKAKLGWEGAVRSAKTVAIIPGYGMALAQAQLQVKQLAELLKQQGKEVRFGIHPVAGRMPGHMNVLLAEVDVPYEELYELDQINAFLQEADLAIIVGANDVVNPAAIELEDTPIYGMPIIRADLANKVIVCNYDLKPGYAGVDNTLYTMEKVELLLGDAKGSLGQLLAVLQGEQTPTPAAAEKAGEPGPVELLAAAKRVVLVPGYGMALAQAQGQVKLLVDLLQKRGVKVEIAVHPVAGRMPGHMNVLMAEVDIPYELMLEMDQINDQFKDVDVAIVVGANDVINPAANTHTDTPIYGMPILRVEDARHVVIYNLDRAPGYAGVPNTLYDEPHCIFVSGDAAQSLAALVQALMAVA